MESELVAYAMSGWFLSFAVVGIVWMIMVAADKHKERKALEKNEQ